jgi:uncharacterized protein YyaL (SSP411 family)
MLKCSPAKRPSAANYREWVNTAMTSKASESKKSPSTPGNHLLGETSTYLLQHAHNPVDWYPWGDEALTRARKEDKPILLSIGYAACHWCHVMEHESFEDAATAALMNKDFVCIKVDREERTDLDEIYMKAVQLMTGHGGWPMTVFLTPDLHPFFGGTYYPPEDRHGLPGFKKVLAAINEAWHTRRKEIEESAKDITQHLSKLDSLAGSVIAQQKQAQTESQDTLIHAAEKMLSSFDNRWGGFGSAPKFPHTFSLELGMRCVSHLSRKKESLREAFKEMVEKTLDCMAYGGIHDQIGGGFARYSVDRQWLVPHFEKMLYDNALLCQTYLNGYLLTGRDYWKSVAEDTMDFVLRELATPDGAFFSSLDADSEGVEGKFYVWTMGEIEQILGSDAEFFCQVYGVSKTGNFEHATNILHLVGSPEELSSKYKLTLSAFWPKLAPLKEKLLDHRSKRVRPGRDEKVLTNWNSLMISALADGYKVTGNEKYRSAAITAADFILHKMTVKGRLLHTFAHGKAKLNGYLDDYAYFTQALLDLAAIDGNPDWLNNAISLTETTLKHFRDSHSGEFYYTSDDHEPLIARPKSQFDGSVPSATSCTAFNLIRLDRISNNDQYRQAAEKLLQNYEPYFDKMPDQFANMMGALDFYLSPSTEIVLTKDGSTQGKELLLALHGHYLPNKVVLVKDFSLTGKGRSKTSGEPALLQGRELVQGKPAVFICRNFACESPITEAKQVSKELKKLAQSP